MKSLELEGKSAIVTGAGAGIGKDIAFKLAEAGASVAVADINEDTVKATVEELRSSIAGDRALGIRSDVAKVDDVKNMVASTISAFGRLDILINNAGIRIVASLTDTSEEDWDRTIAVNLSGIFHCCKYAVPEMIKQGKGKIVNIASIAGLTGMANRLAYSASKGGVIAMTRSLALDLAPHICVNAICPAAILTPMTASFEKDPVMMEFIKQATLLGRWGTGEDVAEAVLYLVSDRSDFVTGTTLNVDGGFMAGKKGK